ncbi:MAG: hypothetical protein HOV78_11605 [Hamadaea sp.]|nr:hypothetical protein [Hamadaea sp.]
MLLRLSGRYGWRGVWLIVVGVAWCVFGVGQFFFPLPDNPWVLFQLLPDAALAAGWWVTGIVAILQGLRGDPHSTADDALGHVALYLMPAVRIASYGFAGLVSVGSWVAERFGYDGRPVGDPTAWYSALLWAMFTTMLAVGASWPNPQPPIPHPPARLLDDGPTP